MYNLETGNGDIILTRERYMARASAYNGIQYGQTNALRDARIARWPSQSDQPYFVRKAANHEIIGVSESYSSESAMENGVRSHRANASTAETADLT